MAYRNHPVTDHRSIVDGDTQFIDVREPHEFATGSLDGAVNIALREIAQHLDGLDPARRTVLLCRSGNRSGQAAEILDDAGFTEVVNLEGGLLAYGTEET